MVGEIVALLAPSQVLLVLSVEGGCAGGSPKMGIHLEEISVHDDHNMFSLMAPFTEDQSIALKIF